MKETSIKKSKRDVYAGYVEKYMLGQEIIDYFSEAYETFGKNHSQVHSTKMDLTKKRKLKSNITYRVFLNDLFCKIMDADTDENVYFWGYTFDKSDWAKD